MSTETKTLCGRTIVDDYTENQQAPPVGLYNPETASKHTDEQAPCYTLKSRIPEKIPVTQVGPASYDNQASFLALQREHPPVKFGASETARFPQPKERSPGPCKYEAVVPLAPISFSLSSRQKQFKLSDNPAPNKYSNFTDLGGLSKSMSGRHDSFNNMFAANLKKTPCPAAYTVKDQCKNTNRGSFSFPKQAAKKPDQKVDNGPAKYNVSDAYNALHKSSSNGRSFGQRCKQNVFFK
ncbi:SHIPPO 1-like protein [Spironucleus salmonicida]|uniref:SHIPPO 1-like protein n=1 Tax=Spironucleus salmonicida TaxID=348837 RepID=V6LLD9_9EUKA|nr:SHIPPO 1-like protein [Spironucleus salmonicida]|eukprot:EST44561.1 SHIPPO 1-like protein [Spironucleus salmonicida]